MVIKDQQENLHVAGGAHKGIVINKNASAVEEDPTPPELLLEFCVFLVSAATKMHTKESRQLRKTGCSLWISSRLCRLHQENHEAIAAWLPYAEEGRSWTKAAWTI